MKIILELEDAEELIYYDLLNDKKLEEWTVKDVKSLARSLASTLYLNRKNR